MSAYAVRRFRVAAMKYETGDAFTIRLEPDDGEPLFAYKAGQFVMVHVYNEDGTRWAKAAYSILNAPSEASDGVDLGIKVTGDFTKRVASLQVGDVVGVQGPYGAFIFRDDGDPLVFFAGGIGITPLRCMIREALVKPTASRVVLFYSCKDAQHVAYDKEFRDLASQHENFLYVPLLTQDVPEGWGGERGRITTEMITRHIPRIVGSRVWMCGPKSFMDAVKDMLVGLGLDATARLHKESFGS